MLNISRQRPELYRPILALWLLMCCSASLYALSSDIKQPVKIDADNVTFDKTKGYAVYEGNVAIEQGSLKIGAQKIEIFAPDNNIDRIVATGSPVSFQQKMDSGKLAKGRASKVEFSVKGKRLVLTGNASLSQDKDTFNSARIEYSTQTGELKAGSGKSANKSQGRVKAIFYPSN